MEREKSFMASLFPYIELFWIYFLRMLDKGETMIVKVKKRKAGSYRDLAFEEYDIPQVDTLEELLKEVVAVELQHAKENKELYNKNIYSLEEAVEIMKQDFEDGLFRVFFNEKEYTTYAETLVWQAENELVFIRLVMMAGRLW